MSLEKISIATLKALKDPPYQRPLMINANVRAEADRLRVAHGIPRIPGLLHVGDLKGIDYLIDGQHRRAAAILSGRPEFYALIDRHVLAAFGEMGPIFIGTSKVFSQHRPDDLLRAQEGVNSLLKYIRCECPFIGYDSIRRKPTSPVLSMSVLLRSWTAAGQEAPTPRSTSAMDIAASLTDDTVDDCVQFLKLAHAAWGRDAEYKALWAKLNLTMCMWLFRHIVLEVPESSAYDIRSTRVTQKIFMKCLMSLSADEKYIYWLVGRNHTDRERGPCYSRLKVAFIKRIEHETGRRPRLPQPAWASGHAR